MKTDNVVGLVFASLADKEGQGKDFVHTKVKNVLNDVKDFHSNMGIFYIL